MDGLDQMLDALDLRELGDDRFYGPGDLENEWGIFGGHLLGQGVMAASLTAPPERAIHSMHAYFLTGAAATGDITYEVERVRDGGTFSHREVKASREGKELFRLIASFQAWEDGATWERPRPTQPAQPTDVLPLPELLASRDEPVWDDYWTTRPRAIDLRYVHAPWAEAGPDAESGIQVWWRTHRPIGDDPRLHAAVAAFVSDESISDNVLTPHSMTWNNENMMVVSLDHAMWFHRPFRVDEWLLLRQRPLITMGARGLASAELHTADGSLVATMNQEALLRI